MFAWLLRLSFTLCSSERNESFVQSQTDLFLCCPWISTLRTRLLDALDGCRVYILPNIRRKNYRDIDGTLGMSVLRFDGIASFCVAKPSESSVVECRYSTILVSLDSSLRRTFKWRFTVADVNTTIFGVDFLIQPKLVLPFFLLRIRKSVPLRGEFHAPHQS